MRHFAQLLRTRLHRPFGAVALGLALSGRALASDAFDGHRFYYGDPHAHTGLSHDGHSSDVRDGCYSGEPCGAFSDVFSTAVSNKLDWVVVSDHVNGGADYQTTEDEYFQLISADLNHPDPGGPLLVIPGAEVWFALPDGTRLGHKNLLMFGDPAAIASVALADVSPPGTLADCAGITTWMDGFVAQYGDAVLVPHHTMMDTPMPTDWACHTAYEPATEVYSQWGSSLGGAIDYDLPYFPYPEGSVAVALDPSGYALQMGFFAGTDGHQTLPGSLCKDVLGGYQVSTGGLTIAVLDDGESLDRASLYRAVIGHRTIATSGPRVPMVLTLSDALGDTWGLGDAVALPAGQDLQVAVAVAPDGASGVTAVWFVTPEGDVPMEAVDGTTYAALVPSGAVPAWGYVAVQFDAPSLGLCSDGGGRDVEWMWMSPSYIRRAGGGSFPGLIGDASGFPQLPGAEDSAASVDDSATDGPHARRCGCASVGFDGAPGIAVAGLLGLVARRRSTASRRPGRK